MLNNNEISDSERRVPPSRLPECKQTHRCHVTQVGLLLSGPSSNWEFTSSRDLFTSLNSEIPTSEHSGTRHKWIIHGDLPSVAAKLHTWGQSLLTLIPLSFMCIRPNRLQWSAFCQCPWYVLLGVVHAPLPSNRHHRRCGDRLEGKGENYQVCSVQYCVHAELWILQRYIVHCFKLLNL